MRSKALIFGISGQDGSLLADFLLKKNYKILGVTRNKNAQNLKKLYFLKINNKCQIIEIKKFDYNNINKIISDYQPDEIYNLSAQSSVSKSFNNAILTFKSIIDPNIYILESIKNSKKKIKFYNACSGECYGNIDRGLANEKTNFSPKSPYAVAKTNSFYTTKYYREANSLFACSGILFNHESIFRSKEYVISKIIKGSVDIIKGKNNFIELGNINIKRDWGWAPEYVKAMHAMINHNSAVDLIIATGNIYSLKEFIKMTFKYLNLDWKNHIQISKNFFRPLDIIRSGGDPKKAEKIIGWKSKVTIDKIISTLIEFELNQEKNKI